ncbi:MAG TPA: YebC/PmpR family DNA-binding transcriptional regulator [Clostridiaceae bacterium]|nr:YebC/PmpR family DNA-binding transcriptional regulator [Clostridiaceae bacterium]
MAGHSKWSNIKHRKGAADEKRAKIFSKIGREIQVAVRSGGPDPETNNVLRDVIAKARSYNMPNDNIQRSISRAAGDNSSDAMEEIQYEGYGPAGVAVMVRVLTDNRNRTAGEVRHIFDKYGGNLGSDGCVAFQFERKGTLVIERNDTVDDDQVFMDALEAGAEDVDLDLDDVIEITTAPTDFAAVRDSLAQKYEFAAQDLGPVPLTWVELEDEETISNMTKLIDLLEDNDDVQDVYHNWAQEDDA